MIYAYPFYTIDTIEGPSTFLSSISVKPVSNAISGSSIIFPLFYFFNLPYITWVFLMNKLLLFLLQATGSQFHLAYYFFFHKLHAF